MGLNVRNFVEQIISKIKGERYSIDKCISSKNLFSICFERFCMLIRGTINRFFLAKCGQSLFVGKSVHMKCKNKITFGSGITISDNVYINAMSKEGIFIGNNFSIGRNSIIECTGIMSELGEKLVIGNNVGISPNAFISVRGTVRIGDDVIIGPNFTLISENHIFEDISKPIRNQGTLRKGITIGSNCWIGANVTILDGVCIGNGVIVAAGAVVNRNIEDNQIIGGVPAKLIKRRS